MPKMTFTFLLVVTAGIGAVASPVEATPDETPYLDAAVDAGKWLRSLTLERNAGDAWPVHAGSAAAGAPPVVRHLYSGVAGVVLYFVEAYRYTGQRRYQHLATRGADYLLATRPVGDAPPLGLYTGEAGVGFVLLEVAGITGDERYRRGARECLALIRKRAVENGAGVEWSDTTDIIAGSAGIGLFLLRAAEELTSSPRESETMKLAERAGRRLLELGEAVGDGTKWKMDPTFPREMPNFSHGTAGVAFFLAALHQATEDAAFLEGAVRGARYVLAIADTANGGCRVRHHTPGGEELFYLGWCHGPPGTARLFRRLHEITGDDRWSDAVTRSAESILTSGIPEERTDGFWNNVGQCCGSAGVVEFFLALHRSTKDEKYLAFARRVADDIVARSSKADRGIHWPQAEHRVKPELIQSQTGYMQGAAGIGIALLHLHGHDGLVRPIRFPDS